MPANMTTRVDTELDVMSTTDEISDELAAFLAALDADGYRRLEAQSPELAQRLRAAVAAQQSPAAIRRATWERTHNEDIANWMYRMAAHLAAQRQGGAS